jgi:hypothetical protein
MNVEEFVQATLVQIANGVESANKTFAEKSISAQANPAGAESESQGRTSFVPISNTQNITFDIAVTIDETSQSSSEKKAGLGLKVVTGGLAGSQSLESSTSTVSRIQFTIPLKLLRPKLHKN